jgi:hypothetical protein
MRHVATRSLRGMGIAALVAAMLFATLGLSATHAQQTLDLSNISTSTELITAINTSGLQTTDEGIVAMSSFIALPGTTLTISGVSGIQAFTFGSEAEMQAALNAMKPMGGVLPVSADTAIFASGNTIFVVPDASANAVLIGQLEGVLGAAQFTTGAAGEISIPAGITLDAAATQAFANLLAQLTNAGLSGTITGDVATRLFTTQGGIVVDANGVPLEVFVLGTSADVDAAINLLLSGAVSLDGDVSLFRSGQILVLLPEPDAQLSAQINAMLGGAALVDISAPVVDVSGVLADLAARGGVTATTGVIVTQPFITVPGVRIMVNGAPVEVFTLATPADVTAALNMAILPQDTHVFLGDGNVLIILQGVSQQPQAAAVLGETFGQPVMTTVASPVPPGAPGAPAPAATGYGVVAGSPAGNGLVVLLALAVLGATIAGGRAVVARHSVR